MRAFLILVGLIALGVGFWGGFNGHAELLWAGYAAFGTALLAANLDQIPLPLSWRSTPETQVRQLIRELDAAINEARLIARETAAFGLRWAKQTTGASGLSLREQEAFRDTLFGALRRLGINDAELADVTRQWSAATDRDYLRLVADLIPKPSEVDAALRAELLQLHQKLDAHEDVLEALQAFLETHKLALPQLQECVADALYYRQHRRHRRSSAAH